MDRSPEPELGASYTNFPYGQGVGVVKQIERQPDGSFVRVEIAYAAGCMICPPEDNPDAPPEEWTLPQGRAWISREEWERLKIVRDG
jgi:hypothetical protein